MLVLCLRPERKANAICSLMPKVLTCPLPHLLGLLRNNLFCWSFPAIFCDYACISAMIQQPRIPSYGMMQASDVVIRAKEVWAVIVVSY